MAYTNGAAAQGYIQAVRDLITVLQRNGVEQSIIEGIIQEMDELCPYEVV